MCWQCDNPHASDEDYLAALRAIISDHGWAIQFVEDARRPFAHTVGLHGMDYPELLITGVSAQTSARLLNSIAHQIVDGEFAVRPGVHIDYQFARNTDTRARPISPPSWAYPRRACRSWKAATCHTLSSGPSSPTSQRSVAS